MKTEQVRFNIIWLDDQIDTLYQDYKDILLEAGIKVLGKGAHDVTEFEQQIQKYKYVVDAVVTDANLNLKVEDDFDGLIDVSYLIEQCNKIRAIPFFVFTGRDNMRTTVNKRTIAKFDGVFDKQKGITDLIDAVKSSVIKVNSPEFRIRNKYAQELSAAALIDGNEERLFNALLYDYSENWENTEDYFNPMRKIIEAVFSKCLELNVIPPIPNNLNVISKFLSRKGSTEFIMTDGQEIMPKPLAESLWYFLKIAQDGSHDKSDLNLKVDEYVRKTHSINIFRAIMHIAMDICLWYKQVKEETESEDFIPKWEMADRSSLEKIKAEYGDITCIPQKDQELRVWHCGLCMMMIDTWQIGTCLKLKDFGYNNNPNTKHKYPYIAYCDIISITK